MNNAEPLLQANHSAFSGNVFRNINHFSYVCTLFLASQFRNRRQIIGECSSVLFDYARNTNFFLLVLAFS